MSGQQAATGNPLIPAHPSVTANRAAELGTGNAQQPAQQPSQGEPNSEVDWGDMIDLAPPQPATPPQQAVAPQGTQPVQQPQQPVANQEPSTLPALAPETLEALGLANAPQVPQQPQQPQQPMSQQQLTEAAINQLAGSDYVIPPEMAKQLIIEPDKVLPQLAAKIHVHIVSQIGQVIQQMLPQMVGGIVQQRMSAQRAESDFYGQYPQLKDPRFRNVVAQSLMLAKQAEGPNATRDQVMQTGALLAINKLRLQQRQQPQQQPQPQQVPQQRRPFMPAMGNGASPQPIPQAAPQTEEEFWAQFSAELET